MILKLICFLFFLFFITNSVYAWEYIIDDKRLPDMKTFVIEYERVKVEINNQVAGITIEQSLENNTTSDIEATLIFPLPEDGGISNFSMYINGKKVDGKIMDKDEASEIYEEIVRKLKDPAILEYSGHGLFRARIYPIPAKGKTKIIIQYGQALKSDGGLTKFKLPLTGHSSQWPLEELAIGIDLKSSVPIKSCYSPTHSIDVRRDGDKHIKAGFESSHYESDEDFVLYYTVSEDDLGLSLMTYRENNDEPGFFVLMASPGEDLKKEKIQEKDIIFVLDTSGSMEDEEKLLYAQKALKFCLGHLNREDRFNIITFSSGIDIYSKNLIKVSEKEVGKARAFLDKLEALGGTNIDEALENAFSQFDSSKRPKYIVFLTDGLPTQGETDAETIIKNISKSNKYGVRLFSFGVGTDVNTFLLDLMAEKNRGYTSYLESGKEMEVSISSFFTKINLPVLSNITLDFGKIKVKDLYPKDLPDLFKGSQLLVFGRYLEKGHVAITISGEVNGKKKKYVYEKTFPDEDKDNTFIPSLWATRKIGYLLNEIRLHGTNEETVDEIVKLSIKYGIVTPYTSFLIQEEINRKEGEPLPVDDAKIYSNMPYVYGYDKERDNNQAGGMPNVQASTTINEYQKTEALSDKDQGAVAVIPTQVANSFKTVGSKTFYFKDGIWIDSLYNEKSFSKKDIEFAGDEYFKLLNNCPDLGKYLSLGNNIIVIFEGKCYHIFSK